MPIETPDMLAECPLVPEGASRYEAQEIRRHYYSVFRDLRDVVERCENVAAQLADAEPLTLANAAQSLLKAAASLAALHAMVDGVEHRKALAEREEQRGG